MGVSSLAVKVVVTSSVTLFLALIALCFRIWARILKKTALQLNDYAIIVAFLLTLGLVVSFCIVIFDGIMGVHIEYVPFEGQVLFLKMFIVCQVLWAAANLSVKISILHLYTRIFPSVGVRRICYGTVALSFGYLISVVVEAFFFCHPAAYNWDKAIRGGHCSNQTGAFLGSGITNLLIDLLICILPLPLLWKLQLDYKKKFGIAAMFSLGFFICVLTIFRIYWLYNWNLVDITYSSEDICIWTVLEPALGVLNACLPVMQPVLQKLSGKNVINTGVAYGSNGQNYVSDDSRGTTNYTRTRAFTKLEGAEFPLNPMATDEDLLAPTSVSDKS